MRYDGAPTGLVKNAPHDEIPRTSVAGLKNAHCYPTEWQPRGGNRIVSTFEQPPALTGRTGYTARKSGVRITATSDIFSLADVSNYWVWPDEPAKHEEIVRYINARQVEVSNSEDRPTTGGCWMHGRLNLWEFHKANRKVVFQWGQEVYVSDWNGANQTKVWCVSADQPANTASTFDEQDEYGVIFNAQGMFHVSMFGSYPRMFKRNSPSPQILLESNLRLDSRPYRFDYTYGMSRLAGFGIRNRTSEGATILQQSGTTKLQGVDTDERDHCTTWKEKPIGDGTKTQGRLICGIILPVYQAPTWWNALAAPGGSFKWRVNDREENFVVDFGATGYNVSSMDEVASAIQETVRLAFYDATCTWDGDEKRFVFTSGQMDASTVGYGAEGVGGTDVSGALNMRIEDGAVVQNGYAYTATNEIGLLTIPRISDRRNADQEWHWTHYTVYRTENIGIDGAEPRVNKQNAEVYPPLKFTWTYDLRVAAAFYASADRDGIITAYQGEFEKADEGSQFHWEDETTDTLGQYIDSTHMRIRAVGSEYYDMSRPLQAAAIGGGLVIRATQTGQVVTRISGDSFSSGDLRRTLWSSSGQEMVIIEVLSTNAVRVDSGPDKAVQGFTLRPTRRMFCDTVTDDTLRARQGETHVGFLENRFWEEMPTASIGVIFPGFIVTARRNGSLLYYCQMGMSKKYMGGYYLPNRQVNDRVEDSIQSIRKLPTRFIVFCKNTTWGGPTNLSDTNIKKLPQFGYVFAVIYVDIIDDRVGCLDYGSIAEVDYGILQMRCSDGSVRQFDGQKYSDRDYTVYPETSQDMIKRQILECWPRSLAIYSAKNNLGYILWLKKQVG